VYLANDLRHNRQVAVKVLLPDVSAALGAERFRQEIEVTARLQHPNILPLFDSGSSGDLHYFVMPFIDGESLYERLSRTPRLRLEEALRIARGIAAGLDAAHEQSILHRDIKPGNILLKDDQVIIADFGIARVLDRADPKMLTEANVALGTPEYMSPEQASASPVDPGTDIYALGCVVYEMLAGEPPFSGPSRQAVVMKHIGEPPPSLRVLRPSAPPHVVRALKTALAKVSADRYATAGAFVTALERRGPPNWRYLVAGAVGTAAVVALVVKAAGGFGGSRGSSPDTTYYAILPFERQSEAGAQLNEVELLHDALGRWTGLTVIDPLLVRDALSESDGQPLTLDAATQLARQLRAGRYIWGEVSRTADSLRIHAALYDTEQGKPLYARTLRLDPGLAGADTTLARMAAALLLRGNPPDGAPSDDVTRSLPARQAYDRGQEALANWNIARADSAFTEATALDSEYAQAHLWAALARWWSGAVPARWRVQAQQAAIRRERMSERDRRMTDAMLAHARGDLGAACALWQGQVERSPRDFVSWYGLAQCQVDDDAVLPDPRSPTDWRFRTSYHRALRGYQRAFELHPPILASFRGGSYASLRDIFRIGGNLRRPGRALPPDTARFGADPTWRGDTLAYVPLPLHRVVSAGLTTQPAEQNEADRHLRLMFRDVALSWVASSPQSADAMEALAIALALLGDPAALDTLRRGSTLVRDPGERFRVAAAEVWMQLAFALPWDDAGLRRTRSLADSLLLRRRPDQVADPWLLAGLAALTGRADLAAAYAGESRAAAAIGAPPSLRGIAPALLVYAALGGPADSLIVLERRVTATIDDALLPAERRAERMQWVARSATLAFSTHRFAALATLVDQGDELLDLQAEWVAGDSNSVRRGLAERRGILQQFLPPYRTLDGLYPEAELLAALGEDRAAAEWLDPTLRALPQVAPSLLASPVHAASLIRAAALRAAVAERLGDRDGARQWASAVVTLWSDADPFLQPLVSELRRLGR
jgi:serine/threonine protein kinase